MSFSCRLLCGIILAAALMPIAASGSQAVAEKAAMARRILEKADVRGGLVVCVDSNNAAARAEFLAGLRLSDAYLVQGLDTNAGDVAELRGRILDAGLSGRVSVDRFDGKRLPFVSNLVNALVVSAPGCTVPADEMLRVLAPNGVALIRKDGNEQLISGFPYPATDIGDGYLMVAKPRPDGIDEWTHFLHGPDNNAVARDSVVGPPQHVQWVGSPKFSRSHCFMTSINAMVSANGRLIYIVDEGPAALTWRLPARWTLVARDAFNGVVLWQRPLHTWQPFTTQTRIPIPPDLFRRLAVVGDTVYVTLGLFDPVTALDAATGKIVRTYEGTKNAEEIIRADGVLYVFVGTQDPSQVDRRLLADRREKPDRKRLLAIEVDTGKLLWTKEDADTEAVFALTLAVDGGRAAFVNARAVVCLDAAGGSVLWRRARPNKYARSAWSTPNLVMQADVVLCADRLPSAPDVPKTRVMNAEMVALSAKSGEQLWKCPCAEGVRAPADIFVVGDTVWVGQAPARRPADYRTGYDLHTGEVRKQFDEYPGWVRHHHHRCYRNKATERFILAGRTGVEYIDLRTGQLLPHQFIRGICRYGILPSNGLLYLPPSNCACYVESKLNGFFALAPKEETQSRKRESEEPSRLERGPAIHPSSLSPHPSSDWPTYRHDNARSGHVAGSVGTRLDRAWSAKLGGKLGSLVCAEGRLIGCQVDRHVVFCLDAASGKPLWRFVAGSRVDSPPALADGLALFGCRDGWVYALRTADGTVAWRYRAAPAERRIVERDRLESVWPVHGSVLVEDGFVYCCAGRTSYLDGGIYLHKLSLRTGEPVAEKRFYSRDPETGAYVPLFKPFQGDLQPEQEMPGLLPDIPSSDGHNLFVRGVAFDRELNIRQGHLPHLFSSMGFLDDTWFERTYWIYGKHFYSGCNGQWYAKKLFPAGRILVFDDAHIYGYRDQATFRGHGLFRVAKQPEPVAPKLKPKKPLEKMSRREQHAWRLRMQRVTQYEFDWSVPDLPIYARAMVLADNALFAAGVPTFDERAAQTLLKQVKTDDAELPRPLADALDKFQGRKGATLLAVSRTDGKTLASVSLATGPVFDGMIAAGGRLYIATTGGKVLCFAGE